MHGSVNSRYSVNNNSVLDESSCSLTTLLRNNKEDSCKTLSGLKLNKDLNSQIDDMVQQASPVSWQRKSANDCNGSRIDFESSFMRDVSLVDVQNYLRWKKELFYLKK